ncbi:MAG: hypothetical protein BI182_02760 [Acetobacterium sp. MES1]|nr:MAG: hypothetical protein BI182_02760 [Acetobacterium sp. MES1]
MMWIDKNTKELNQISKTTFVKTSLSSILSKLSPLMLLVKMILFIIVIKLNTTERNLHIIYINIG